MSTLEGYCFGRIVIDGEEPPPTMMKLGLVFMGEPYRGAGEWVVHESRSR